VTKFAAGALQAFGLRFDEVVDTIFTAPPGIDALPLWILKEVGCPNQASVVNARAGCPLRAPKSAHVGESWRAVLEVGGDRLHLVG
jgi:hypothetical protein